MTVEPTVHDRSRVLDVLRGVAILGILLVNIPAFSQPSSEMYWGTLGEANPGEAWLEAAFTAFVSGKMRSLLAILFGVGLYLQFRKRTRDGSWPGGYLKRTMFLGLMGAFHGLFIWYGDILLAYSFVAFVATFIVDRSRKTIATWIGLCSGLSLIAALLIGALVAAVMAADLSALQPEPTTTSTQETVAVPEPPSKPLSFLEHVEAESEREIEAFQNGSYLDQLALRSELWVVFGLGLGLGLVFFILPLFLIGVLLAEREALTDLRKHPRTRNWLLGLGLGLGLPLNAAALLMAGNPALLGLQIAIELFFGPLLALGYLGLLAMWASSGALMGLQRALANVGRTALSCYLMQSLLCTTVFYSWGLGWFGRLTSLESLIVVGAVWAANLIFAALWLRRYSIGPAEWLLRSLTEGRRLPWRFEPRPATATEPARAGGFEL